MFELDYLSHPSYYGSRPPLSDKLSHWNQHEPLLPLEQHYGEQHTESLVEAVAISCRPDPST